MVVFLAAPPPAEATPQQLAGWVEDLESDDADTWRQAVDRLWRAGRVAEPVVRKTLKHRDADVVLRARLVLSRFEWGIYPSTPDSIVKLIERYRDGDLPQRKVVVDE